MKTLITNLVAGLSVMIAGFMIGIFTMIFGWGIQPKSWAWVVIGGFANMFLAGLYGFVYNREK